MKLFLLLGVFLLTTGFCQNVIRCDEHNAEAYRKRSEVRYGHRFTVYEHTYFEHGKRQTHSLKVECD